MARSHDRPLRSPADRGAAQHFIIGLLRSDDPATSAALSDLQWQCVVEEAAARRLAALMWRRLSEGAAQRVPAGVLAVLREHYVRNAFRNAVLFRETATTARALAAESIPTMVLKGICLARFVYQEPALRTMADIDLMVPRERLRDAERIMVGLGYGPHPRPDIDAHCEWSNHLAGLEKEGAEVVEIHYALERPNCPFDIDHAAIWSGARTASIDGAGVVVLGNEHLLLHLCLHLAYHHRFARSGLKGVIDIATLIARASPLDWTALARTANQWKAGGFTYAALRVASEILAVPVPGAALAALDHDDGDDDIVDIATRFVLAPPTEGLESLVEIQRARGWRERLGFALKGVFPPIAKMRELYGLPAESRSAWTLYPRRTADLLERRAGLLARLALRTPAARPLIDREKDRRSIDRWAGHGDARGNVP